jgi:hypothetical protein
MSEIKQNSHDSTVKTSFREELFDISQGYYKEHCDNLLQYCFDAINRGRFSIILTPDVLCKIWSVTEAQLVRPPKQQTSIKSAAGNIFNKIKSIILPPATAVAVSSDTSTVVVSDNVLYHNTNNNQNDYYYDWVYYVIVTLCNLNMNVETNIVDFTCANSGFNNDAIKHLVYKYKQGVLNIREHIKNEYSNGHILVHMNKTDFLHFFHLTNDIEQIGYDFLLELIGITYVIRPHNIIEFCVLYQLRHYNFKSKTIITSEDNEHIEYVFSRGIHQRHKGHVIESHFDPVLDL